MIKAIPQTKWYESLRFLLAHFLPYYLSGIFIRSRFFTGIFHFFHIHPFHPRFFERLQQKYASDTLWVKLPGNRILLLFNPNDIQIVLDHSPAVFAEPGSKLRGMSHFQPNAVTISRGRAWQKRRNFNETVLDTRQPVHRESALMLQRIGGLIPATAPCRWSDFSALFDEIALTVVFGLTTTEDRAALNDLYALMTAANRLFWLKPSTRQAKLEALIRQRMHQPPDGSLLAMMPPPPHDPEVKPARQVAHWLFALGDTLAINTVRCLMLIVSDADTHQRVISEIKKGGTTAESIDGMALLEACLQETMRLWPTTPVLARKLTRRSAIADSEVAAGTDVMILNNVLHRSTRLADGANHFRPSRWNEAIPPYAYNAMSNGTQACAGRHLALLLGKYVLAELLTRWNYTQALPSMVPGKAMPYSHNYFRQRFRISQDHD